jgi:arylsulfatase A-like enzyme
MGAGTARASCDLNSVGHKIKHVMYFQFDNTHFTRDNPNVPSDLEQMPHLLNFLTGKGVLDANHHTPLISHTATDILTSLTGVYGARMGVPVANSFGYFRTDGSVGFSSSFGYWTDTIANGAPLMVNDQVKTSPAPWVPFTRAGCDVGGVATANIEFENNGDVTNVFGAGSIEDKETSAQKTSDFLGIAVHCAEGSAFCATGKQDALPDEPGGYNGYMAQFGHKNVAPLIAPGGLKDLDGNPINGFPGFDGMSAPVTLAYVAAMHEHGVDVTYAYISDAHDNHATDNAFGPGEAGYVAQLAAYDHAFKVFFDRLAADGITADNTLFIFTADEGDHFAGGPPSPTNCDGVHTPCTYTKIGEVDAYLDTLLAAQQHVTAPFSLHFDDAPTVYIKGNPGQFDPTTRGFETAMNALTAVSPITGNTDRLTVGFADRTTMQLLHMVTHDQARTPSFTLFGDPDYFFLTGGSCSPPNIDICENPAFAWNHGDIQPEIITTWLGMVGPGVERIGVTKRAWSDHTDTRPTILSLVGLRDDYSHDGRALTEFLTRAPRSDDDGGLEKLAQLYKQINAPVGSFSRAAVRAITRAIASNDPGEYAETVNALRDLGEDRDEVANAMIALLEGATFGRHEVRGSEIDKLTDQASKLLERMHRLAGR